MIAYDPAAWRDLFEAVASAAAALAGLIFVAVSINLRAILEEASALPLRAAEALLVLVSILLIAVLVLVPGQDGAVLGAELTAMGAVLLVAVSVGWRHRHRDRGRDQPWHWTAVPLVIMLLSSVPVVAAGVSLLVGTGGGLYWLVPELIFGFSGAVYNAWILLIEILR